MSGNDGRTRQLQKACWLKGFLSLVLVSCNHYYSTPFINTILRERESAYLSRCNVVESKGSGHLVNNEHIRKHRSNNTTWNCYIWFFSKDSLQQEKFVSIFNSHCGWRSWLSLCYVSLFFLCCCIVAAVVVDDTSSWYQHCTGRWWCLMLWWLT